MKNLKIKKILIVVLLVLCVIFTSLFIFKPKGMFVTASTDVPTGFSDFDNWMMNEVGIEATPAHLIIKEGKVTSYVDFGITKEEFKQYLNNDFMSVDVWNSPIKTVDGQEVLLKDFDVVYVTKAGCDACKQQEEYNEPQIFKKYKNLDILVYYISTEKENATCLKCG